MPEWLMWVVGIALFLLPILLAIAFNGENRADSRGRRLSARWHH